MMKKIKFALAAVVAMSVLAPNVNGASAHNYHHGGYGDHHNGYGHHHGCGCCGH
jgi:hypothetical protein